MSSDLDDDALTRLLVPDDVADILARGRAITRRADETGVSPHDFPGSLSDPARGR